MNTTSYNGSNDNGSPFKSLADLKDVHTSLLKKRGEDFAVGFLDEVEDFLRRGSALGVYLDSYNERAAGQSLLDYWVTVLYRAKRTPPDATLAEFDPSSSPILDDGICPYRGLNAFQEADREIFFGRQRLVETLVQKIGSQRLLFVVGSSGSGKSSLVLAGLVPMLKNGIIEGSDGWQYIPRVVPGHNPLRSLAQALAEHFEQSADWANQLMRDLLSDATGLDKAVSGMNDAPAVIVVDQFEESYTLCTNDAVREAFINSLISFAQAPGRNNLVVVTLRIDYTAYLGQSPALLDLFADGQITVTPLTAAELRAAIEEPAHPIGLKFEDGIVDSLVKDILGEPAGLPLLQFTLLRLWKTREGGRSRITWKEYNRLNGPRNALALTADEVYSKLTPANQFAAKKILLRLARPSGNMEVTSNRVKRSELYFLAKDRINEVLGRLSKEGLIRITKGEVEDNDQVEVAHEALVRNWPLLAGWLETERGAMRQRVRLTSAAEQWQENTKDDGGLIGGELLKQALAYDDLNELEMEFVKASKEAAERAKWEKKNAAEREQELEREKLLALEAKAEALQGRTLALQGKAEEQARSALRLRRYVFALILLTLLTSVAATAAILQSRRASASGRDAEIKAAEAKRQTTLAEESARIATWEKVTADQERARATENERLATIASEKAETESRKAKEEKARAERLLVEATAAKARAVKLADELAEKVKLEKERSDKLTAEQMRREEESRIESEKQANITNKRREAARYTKRRNYLAAIVEYEELLELYKETKDKRSEIDILIETARAYRSLGDEMKKNRSYAAQAEEYFKESDSAFMKAVALLDQEINIKKSEAGGDNTVVIDAYEDLARLYAEHSKADESAETYKAALKYQEASLTSDDVFSQILYEDVFQQLATLYKEGKEPRLRELEGIYKERVDKYLVLYKETVDPDLMLSLKELADFYLSQERFEEAERHYKQSLDIVQRYGNDGPVNYGYLLDSIYGLGETNYRKLNYVAAEGHFRSILDRMKATPEMYPYADEDISAKTKERLGDVLVDQKKLQVAAQFYADAVESYKELNWEEAKTKQADTLRKLAEVKFDLSNASSPERNALRRQAAEALSSAFVVNPALKENPDANLILFVRNLTRAGFAENTDAEIKKLYDGLMVVLVSPYEKSLAAHEQIILKSGQIAASKERAGYEEDFVQVERIYKEQADFSKLEDLYKRALKVREKLYGGIDQYQVYNTFRALGALYRDSKKFELAEGSYTQALEIIKRVFKTSNSYFLAESSKDLATVYAELKKFKEAETLYKQAIFIYEKLDLDKSPLMADTFKGYAKLLRLMGRETEAREKEREAEKIRAD